VLREMPCGTNPKHVRSSIYTGPAGCEIRPAMTRKAAHIAADPKLQRLLEDAAAGKTVTDDGRNIAAVILGRLGGLKGGQARAKSLSSETRSQIARNAATARWAKKKTGAQ
jgi:hypothetical protein